MYPSSPTGQPMYSPHFRAAKAYDSLIIPIGASNQRVETFQRSRTFDISVLGAKLEAHVAYEACTDTILSARLLRQSRACWKRCVGPPEHQDKCKWYYRGLWNRKNLTGSKTILVQLQTANGTAGDGGSKPVTLYRASGDVRKCNGFRPETCNKEKAA